MSESNKLIAEFMELPFKMRDKETKLYYKVCEIPYPLQREHLESTYEEINLKYHISWDWLMPVVEKILDISFQDENDVEDFYSIRDCIPNINHTYKAIVQFIKKYKNE